MANNRYVGARYVPIVVGSWDNSVTYEALSVVMYQGDSYISKIPVPVGIDITNIGYWVKCADYNAQWAAYQETAFTMAKLADALITVTDTGTANIGAGNNNVSYQSNLTTEHNIDPAKYLPIAIIQATTDAWTQVQISEWQLYKTPTAIRLNLRLARLNPDTSAAISGIGVTCNMLLLKIAD